MKKPGGLALWLRLGLFLLLAAVVHLTAVAVYPYGMTAFLQTRFARKVGVNQFYHAARPTPDERDVPMPCPDLIYSAAAFDVSRQSLHITAPFTGSYASLSFYASNMDNFFVENDREAGKHGFDIVLTGSRTTVPKVTTRTRVVRAPSDTGIILCRFFAGNGSEAKRIETLRRQVRCTTLGR